MLWTYLNLICHFALYLTLNEICAYCCHQIYRIYSFFIEVVKWMCFFNTKMRWEMVEVCFEYDGLSMSISMIIALSMTMMATKSVPRLSKCRCTCHYEHRKMVSGHFHRIAELIKAVNALVWLKAFLIGSKWHESLMKFWTI